jgi:cytochrome d ubiquinol oxidase subunit II
MAFEYRSKDERPEWRARWDEAIFWGSLLPAVLWGVAFANIVRGVPIGADHEFAGNFFDLLSPYALLGGVTMLLLFCVHGATFLTLKTQGALRTRAQVMAKRLALPAAGSVVAFLAWTYFNAKDADHTGLVPGIVPFAAMGAAFAVEWLLHEKLEAWAFAATSTAITLITATMFLNLYPRVMPSSIDEAYSLTVENAASTPTTLKVMTVVALIMTPIVLAYQGWTLWVFRNRVARPPDAPAPIEGAQPSET